MKVNQLSAFIHRSFDVFRRRVGMGDEAAAAAGFVSVGRADDDARVLLDDALRVVGGLAAANADGVRLGDVLGDGEQLRHRLEGLAGVVLIEAGDDDARAASGEFVGDLDEPLIEELSLVNADNFGVGLGERKDFVRRLDDVRLVAHLGMRHDVIARIARVDLRLEDLHTLARDLGAAQAADQLF